MTATLAPPPDVRSTHDLDSRLNRLLLAGFRIGVAFLWIENTGWKTPPHFHSLRVYTQDAVTHPVWHPFALLVQHVVLPNFTFFAWLTLIVETSLGALLLVGLATRLVALAGLAQVLAITFSALNAPGEWEWSYYLMMLVHVALFATAAGRSYGLDGLLRPMWERSSSRLAKVLVICS